MCPVVYLGVALVGGDVDLGAELRLCRPLGHSCSGVSRDRAETLVLLDSHLAWVRGHWENGERGAGQAALTPGDWAACGLRPPSHPGCGGTQSVGTVDLSRGGCGSWGPKELSMTEITVVGCPRTCTSRGPVAQSSAHRSRPLGAPWPCCLAPLWLPHEAPCTVHSVGFGGTQAGPREASDLQHRAVSCHPWDVIACISCLPALLPPLYLSPPHPLPRFSGATFPPVENVRCHNCLLRKLL